MKKFFIILFSCVAIAFGAWFCYYDLGIYISFANAKEINTFTKVEDKTIYIDKGNGYEEFTVKGVDMGSGQPNNWSTDFAITEETYLEWFPEIKAMGANCIRVYTVQNTAFYNALYEYNKDNDDPLYLIQGVWVSDYTQNSSVDAYDDSFFDTFKDDCKIMIDCIHGKRTIWGSGKSYLPSGNYRTDVSQWVIGYILGVEWEDVTVAYTNEKYQNDESKLNYSGKYVYVTADATPFENMLAQVMDTAIEYETERYSEQRIVAMSNWPTTDPFDYPETLTEFFQKCAKVDVENIKTTDAFIAGQFASYHVYSYYPDYLTYLSDWSDYGLDMDDYEVSDGVYNTYRAYLTMLNEYHTMPVVISEFGVSTGRGMAQEDQNLGRNQGNMSEEDQGNALISEYEDIIAAGCSGGCVFSWSDEWFKRTWNTMYSVDLSRTPYWSDYQTNEQYFGLLSFDPGEDTSVCYVDGDVSEWTDDDIVSEDNGTTLSMKYDEKFVYFYVHSDGYDFSKDKLYIPIDTTQKSGASYCENFDLNFDRDADFLIIINGENNSRIMVQEYYEALRANYSENAYEFNTYLKDNIPEKYSAEFTNIFMILQVTENTYRLSGEVSDYFETGKLTYGNANPESEDFNSLADFICNGEDVEIKIPWQMLNFSDPSRMMIHDDYYENYGVQSLSINKMYAGVSVNKNDNDTINLGAIALKGWGNKATYHERLKTSYYMLKEFWTND